MLNEFFKGHYIGVYIYLYKKRGNKFPIAWQISIRGGALKRRWTIN